MQLPASPIYSDGGLEFPQSPQPRSSLRIDYTKFRTKMCRHYLQKVPCPFEDRCVFSHGTHSPGLSSSSDSPMSSQRRPQKADKSSQSDDSIGSECPSESNSDSCAVEQPPEYSAAVQDDSISAMYSPPAYPRRYRYDPYSFTGILYES